MNVKTRRFIEIKKRTLVIFVLVGKKGCTEPTYRLNTGHF